MSFLYFLAFGMLMPVLPKLVVDDLHGGELEVGIMAGAVAVSAVVVRPFLGHLANAWGRRRLIIIGLILATVAFAGHAIAPEVLSLIGLRLLAGAAHAMFFVAATTLVTDLAAPARRGEVVSYFSTAPYLGTGFGPVIGETLGHAIGYRHTILVATALAACAIIPALLLPRGEVFGRPRGEEHALTPERRLSRAAFGPGTVLALGFVGTIAFTTFLPLYTREIGLAGSQRVYLTYAAVILVVRTVGGRLPDMLGSFRAGTVATALTALGLVLIASTPEPVALYLGTAALAAGVALQYPALLTMSVNRVPERERTVAAATFTMFFDLAQGLGGAVLGQVATLGGIRLSYLAAAVCALMALVVRRTWGRTSPSRQIDAGASTSAKDASTVSATTPSCLVQTSSTCTRFSPSTSASPVG
jgi:predicted MFS family arabinose efflux permease